MVILKLARLCVVLSFALLLMGASPHKSGFYSQTFEQAVQIMMDEDIGVCSGAVVDEDTVLTAAHCIKGDVMYVKFYDGVVKKFKVVGMGEPGESTDWAFLKGDTRGIRPWRVSREIPNLPSNMFFVSFNPGSNLIGITPIHMYELQTEKGKFFFHFLGAPIPGDSGSPILNEDFEVVGVVFAYYPYTDIGLGASSFFFDHSF